MYYLGDGVCVDLENFHARLLIGQGDLNLTVQSGKVIDCQGETDHGTWELGAGHGTHHGSAMPCTLHGVGLCNDTAV